MANTTNVTIRIDKALRDQAEELFADFGLNMTSAYIMFIKQALREQRIPFEIRREIPNETTIAAIKEAEQMEKDENAKTYTSVDELMEDLMA